MIVPKAPSLSRLVFATIAITWEAKNSGLMFDIEAKDDIIITAFKFYASGFAGGTAQVWSRPGTHAGYEYSSSTWTQVAEHSFETGFSRQLVEIPQSSFTQFDLIATNTRRAFYLTFQPGNSFFYDSGVGSLEAVNVEDGKFKLYEGHAKYYFFDYHFPKPY